MRSAIQNASFQLGDFAVMVGGGVDASRALATQLPQLLGPFGVLGAVMSAVVAIGIPLASVFAQNAENADFLGEALGTVYPMVEMLGSAMEAVTGIAVQFGEVILNNLDRIIITAGVAATFFAGKFVAGFIAARVATFSLAGALTFLRGALIRTGFGALIVGAGELVYQFTRLIKAAGSFGEVMGLLKEVAVEVWERIKIVGKAGIDYLIGQFGLMHAGFVNALAKMAGAASDFFLSMSDGLRGSGIPMLEGMASGLGSVAQKIGQAGGNLSRTAMGLDQSARDSLAAAGDGFDAAGAPLKSVQKIRDVLASIKDDKITLPDLLGAGDEEGEGGGSGGKSKTSKKLDEELTAQEERIKEHFDRIKALTEGGLSDKLGSWGDYFGNLASLTQSNNQKLLGISKTFAAASALIDAYQAYNQVLADPLLPWYAKAAAAGQVLAAGLGAVNAIRSVSSSGSTSGSSSAGGSSSPSGGQDVNKYLTIDVTGARSPDADTIIKTVQDAISDGWVIKGVS